ncbi:3-dehydroquinate synthase family protein [Streptomyces sp. NPDC052051]|uniref:3-dehydroquinate synthase family protein n=1 Tax=Streptomyces sp. NPDC052051 TaxID=3154649 RepID=UPI00341E892D
MTPSSSTSRPVTAPAAPQETGTAPYPVIVGHGLDAHIDRLLGEHAVKVALVHPPALAAAARHVTGELERHGRQVVPLPVPVGEHAKDAGVLVYLWTCLAQAGLTRSDAVVALGGGATADLAGLLAATWQGGIRLVLAPSTLLGMVGAADGGRGALNIPQGKNLVSAHHEPAGVVCDLDLLRTVPHADHVGGLAEVVKTALLTDPALLDLIEADPAAATDPASDLTAHLVERSVHLRATLTHGTRGFLDYGHTLGHALEHTQGYRIRHSHAVSIGMVYAAELAHQAGRLADHHVARHRDVLRALGLPTTHPRHAWERLNASLTTDGDTRARRLSFVVLDAPGHPGLLENPAAELLHAAYLQVAS